MKTFKNFGHQGDLNFRKIKKLPENLKLKEIKFDETRGGFTLALGEHSGHAHTLVANRPTTKIRVSQDEQGRHYLMVEGGAATLLHGTFVAPAKINETETDKHGAIVFNPGIYLQDNETEYDPFLQQIRKVLD